MDKCNTCHNPYSPDCNWNQGRCPNHPPIIKIQPKKISKGHLYISLVKGGLRIVAGYALINSNLVLAGALFITAEALGVLEELV